ncbi:chromatin assembly factor 1 subunit A-A-like [Pieris brassicae]|uniref:chromatin assembly factor 1 subunit A-A-like n=1 Tax=Pieris brassicae TaxID=7116 RepID=UPI001E662014|nr:chromatin assembly factor 1 subunit A-A-like [Pieris brassicae]
MKPQKSPGNEEVTPSKKVLKQARLPFQILSDTSPKPDDVSTRKRKLSAPEHQPITKIGKITKENDIQDPVIVSDDDSKDGAQEFVSGENVIKKFNPFVKLVDTAWKKKQKSKTAKNKKAKKDEPLENDSTDNGSKDSDNGMDVDEIQHTYQTTSNSQTQQLNDIVENLDIQKSNSIITLEDSNDVAEVKSNDKKSDDDILIQSDCEDSQKEEDSLSNVESKASSPVTPRRTPRRKVDNGKKSLNMSQTTDDSGSNQNTPKRNTRSSSLVKSEGDVSMTENSSTNLTPKQLQKKLEHAKKREEREKKKQQEREEKERVKQEKEILRKKEKEEKEEARRREREEKEEQKKKEREEKEKQKELEKKVKEEKEEQKRKEREEKDEQKRKEKEAKDEERRKKQEALEMDKLEQEQKKKKAAEAFASFFVPKQKADKDQTTICLSKNDMLSNFTIKADMRLAPTVRNPLTEDRRSALDMFLESQNVRDLYIKNLRSGKYIPIVADEKTWPINEKDEDVVIVEDELPPIDGAGEIVSCDLGVREKLRPKLLSFHENRRPPYWGTWRKKSTFIKPRQPFSMDQKQLEYEVDSDEEWEEEEGESIEGSAAGSDDEGPDEYELDNEVFVPHGYLSDEEATMDDDDVMSLSPETQKARLKHLEDEFESELKKPTEKLKPRLYGLFWETENGKSEKCVDALWNYFSKVSMIMNDPPIMQSINEPDDKKKVKKKKVSDVEANSPAEKKKKEKKEKKEPKESKQKSEKQEKNQLGINAFLTKVKSS